MTTAGRHGPRNGRPPTLPPPTSVALSPGTLSPLAGARLSPRPVRSLPAASLHR